nr:PAS domain S-box protein [Desulfobulbaceae bacterium]
MIQLKTILCVDVDSAIVESLVETLGQSYQVKTADTADTVLSIMAAQTVDLAIFGCLIGTGELETLLKSCHNAQPFCKVILIGDSSIQLKDKAFTVHGFCQKPVDTQALLSTIHSLVNDRNTAVFLDRMTDQSVKYSLTKDEDPDSHKQYARFLETFKVGVCLADEEGVVEYVNKKGCELFGVQTGEKLLGVPLSSLFRIDKDRELHFLKKYVKREWTPQPLVMIRPDGSDMATQANVTFSESNPPRVVTIFFAP